MNAIREQLNRPLVLALVVGVVTFIVGFFIGLVIFGWGLTPVKYYDAAPSDLRTDLQEDYLRMAIDSYAATNNAALAKQRWDSLGAAAPAALKKIQANPQQESPQAIAAFATLAQMEAQAQPGATKGPAATQPGATPGAAATPAPKAGISPLAIIIPIMCIITLVLLGILLYLFVFKGTLNRRPVVPAEPLPPATTAEEWAAVTGEEEPPIVQYMVSYKLGDNLFDDSHSIDSGAGDFLGQCGVSISDTIGVGDPKKVSAFEVWLFDKDDIQTVTKVVMSAHAFNDEATRQRLATKGEPVEATRGAQAVLETKTLQLVARVVDMSYGEGPLPPESFFQNLVLELAIWPKANPPA